MLSKADDNSPGIIDVTHHEWSPMPDREYILIDIIAYQFTVQAEYCYHLVSLISQINTDFWEIISENP